MLLPISVLSVVTRTLEKLGIRYVLVGSFASSMHGVYRATADVDILAELNTQHIRPLYDALNEEFYIDEQAIRGAIARRGSFNAIHFDSVFKVDIFVAGNDEFAFSQLDRRELRKLSPDSQDAIYVATAEDTILAKLRWYRAGDESSNSQWRDVLGILGTLQASLDQDYLKSWAAVLDISDLLERALSEMQTGK